jgi:hypothetical protein
MERDNQEGKVQFQKIGGGSHRLGKRIIKPGEKFWAFPYEIPDSVKDIIVPVNGDTNWNKPSKTEATPVYPITKVTYTIEPNAKVEQKGKSKLWYNLTDKDGNVLNEKALKKEEAEALITYNLVNSTGKVLNEKALSLKDAEELLEAVGK